MKKSGENIHTDIGDYGVKRVQECSLIKPIKGIKTTYHIWGQKSFNVDSSLLHVAV